MLRLKGLTVAGFKSFVDRTELEVPAGITCIVGPNGCGKSNVLDAISWVLGEQSAKSLRGSSMEDVIFAGSRSRKPAGRAEVSLHFEPKPVRPGEMANPGETMPRGASPGAGLAGDDDAVADLVVADLVAGAVADEPAVVELPVAPGTGDADAAPEESTAGDETAGEAAPKAPSLLDEELDSRLLEPLEITRRLYRNGDSEYLINGQRSRRKDIVHLLVAAGLGTRIYSIIEQGRVAQVLQSKPTDRRILIEEAAGITGYKAKRRSARLKLDESERSLERVTDIIAELEKQLRSLKRQASTARRYRRHSRRHRIVLRALVAVKHSMLLDELQRADAELATHREEVAAGAAGLARMEDEAGRGRERVASAEARRDEMVREAHEVHLELDRAKGTLESSRDRLADTEARLAKKVEAAAGLAAELEQVVERRDACGAVVDELDADLAASGRELQDCTSSVQELRRRADELEEQTSEYKDGIFGVMSESAGLRNRRHELEASKERLGVQLARLREAVAESESETERLAAERAAISERLAAVQERQAELRDRRAKLQVGVTELAEKVAAARRDSDAARSELHDAQWKLEAVRETVRTRAAYAEGVRTFLADEPEGVLGTVADFVTVRAGDELAVERALGPWLQAVVFASPEATSVGVARVVAGTGSEIHFLATGEAADAAGAPAGVTTDAAASGLTASGVAASGVAAQGLSAQADPRILGAIGDSLTFAEPHAERLAALVAPAWLVETAEHALDLARAHPGESFVSRDGAAVGPGIRGCAGHAVDVAAGILATQTRRDELEENVASLQARATEHVAALDRVEAAHREAVGEMEGLDEAVSLAEREELADRHALSGLNQAADAASARQSSLFREHEAHAEECRHAEERLADFERQLSEKAKEQGELEAQLAACRADTERLERELGEAEASLARLREARAAKAERREGAAVALAKVDSDLAQARERAGVAQAEQAELEQQKQRVAATVEELSQAIPEGAKRLEELESQLESVKQAVVDGRSQLVDGAERLRDLRSEHDRVTRLAHQAEVRRERVASQLGHVESDCRKELGVEASELEVPSRPEPETVEGEGTDEASAESETAEAVPETVAAEEPSAPVEDAEADASDADETGSSAEGDGQDTDASEEDIGDAGAVPADEEETVDETVDESLPWTEDGELDLEALEAEAEELRGKISRLGPVNLVAISEHDELAERHGFLAGERADLLSSIASLRTQIAEIDTTSHRLFVEAFESVRESFDGAFQTLFRGGRAELRLQEGEDPLESGIEIIAQPPGKRLQNMMLLSGGEKALTAIALLFALFRYKPSPFCILDEVDAPLDESNVVRFIELVEEMSDETQFIVITHARRSMERARVLYGVTMQEPGCSKLVSVRFDEVEESAA